MTAVTCLFVILQEGNMPQGSSHGVKISEPQKKTSFFRCSLLWGPRPSILAASWLDINGLCLLLALPSPFFFLPIHGLSSQSTQTIIFPVSRGLFLSSSESFQWCISSIIRRSVVFMGQSAWLVEDFTRSIVQMFLIPQKTGSYFWC